MRTDEHISDGGRRALAPRRLLRGALPAVLLLVAACTGDGGGGVAAAAAGQPGVAGVGDPLFPRLGNGGYDVRHYGLTLDYVPEGNELHGIAVVKARAKQELNAFNLDFKGLKVRTALVDGKSARVSRKGDEMTVTPRSTIAKGDEFEAKIVYDGTPQRLVDADDGKEGWVETDDGSVSLGEPMGSMTWFPGNHHPSDKATYDIDVTVPKGFTAVANGELKRKKVAEDGRTTFAWHTAEPMASYLASVAVGDFTVSETKTKNGLPVYVALDPDEAERSKGVETLIPKVVEWGSGLFGPYPFSGTGAVVDNNPDVDYALETQAKPYFPHAPDDLLVVHELVHQWFGNSVSPRTWRDMWLNESFPTYAEWMWEEKTGGRTVAKIFQDFYDGTDKLSKNIWDFPPGSPPADDVSGDPVYGRGAMVLHKLRVAVGDKTFFDILRTWTKEHRHGNAETREFIDLCEKKSGKDLGKLFESWLYGKAKPPRGAITVP
ncbi:M1 family metallopeptidase [Streptomyces syringium]|uniref:M1 family metallopeptidase n=1 Tax=Streptomyces syringium TaxID=76729 RepID=UPI0036648438